VLCCGERDPSPDFHHRGGSRLFNIYGAVKGTSRAETRARQRRLTSNAQPPRGLHWMKAYAKDKAARGVDERETPRGRTLKGRSEMNRRYSFYCYCYLAMGITSTGMRYEMSVWSMSAALLRSTT
jgi:hypothetical protein